MEPDTATADSEHRSGILLRAAIVETVVSVDIGVTDRELAAAVRSLGSPGLDLEAVLDTLLVLRVLERKDQRIVATDRSSTFLKGVQIAVAG